MWRGCGGVAYSVLLKKMKAVIVYCDFFKKPLIDKIYFKIYM